MKLQHKTISLEYALKKSCSINLGYSIDDKFARCTGTSIYSFVKNNPHVNISAHIITSNLSSANINRFKLLAKENNINIYIYIINTEFLEKLNLSTSIKWPLAIYFRFLFPFLINDINIIYYMDGDIICHNECSEFFNTSLNGNTLAASIDHSIFTTSRCDELHLPQNTYFNSGVMIIDLIKWQENNTWDKFLEIINSDIELKSFDQDILNIIFSKKTLYLDTKYNYPTWLKTLTNQDIQDKQAILLHFGGHPKPWQIIWSLNKKYTSVTKDIYSSYEKHTPWGTLPLDMPMDYKDKRLYAILLKKQGKYASALKEFLAYSKKKIQYKLAKK